MLKPKDIAILGDGNAASLFFEKSKKAFQDRVAFFLTDYSKYDHKSILGVPVIGFESFLEDFDKKFRYISKLVFAIPSLSIKRKVELLSMLPSNLKVASIPSLQTLASSEKSITDTIDIENIFSRTQTDKITLPYNHYKGSTILVTGGGGSIGSEVCIQLKKIGVKKLIVLDISELNLFNLTKSLVTQDEDSSYSFHPILGSVIDQNLLDSIFREYSVDFVIHCAAYKHVNTLEIQPRIAFINNVLGTYICAKAAAFYKVKNFTLVSTDKAVNPTNIMGMTKFICEKIMVNLSFFYETTNFDSVRFGNVIGSSGSVLPIFEERILKNVHLELTDKRATRFFMSIAQAVSLILLVPTLPKEKKIAGTYFLDMGKPKKMLDVAKTVIKLHGKQPFFNQNLSEKSAVMIKLIGLRAGEKLNEEISYSPDSEKTEVKGILKERTVLKPALSLLQEIKKITSKYQYNNISNNQAIEIIKSLCH